MKEEDMVSRSIARTKASAVLFVTVLVAMLSGCGPSQPYVTSSRLERGLVIVLPGIEGRSVLNEAICKGLDDGGVNAAIELHDWTAPLGPLYNLRAERRNRKAAEEIAQRIVRYQMSYPHRPVLLVGQSGGGAMAVWTIEALPPGTRIEAAVLLSASLSPKYMLDTALERSRRGMVNFYSHRDWFLLGVGTTLTGTMDGEHTSSAGRTGFEVPGMLSRPACYRKLYQVPWEEQMAETGHTGGHLTVSAARFIATYVAPFINKSNWSEEFVEDVLSREPLGAGRLGGSPYSPPVQPMPQTAPATAPSDDDQNSAD
ncbi:MAG: hypothetical protein ACOC9S_04305 [Planctomycetota bacterium]